MKKNYVTLEDVCIKGSSNIAQKDLENNEGKYPIYGASGFIKNVDFYVQEKPYIAVVKDGAGIGRTMMLPAYSSVIGTMQYLLPKDNIDISYLYYAVTAMNLAKYYTGATIPHIYFKDYRKEKLPLVDKLEQKKIVEVLSKIDALVICHKRQLDEFEVLVKSRFIEMFGGIDNPKKFSVVNVEEIADIMVGVVIKPAQYYTDEYNGVKTFRSLNIGDMKIKDSDWVYFSEEGNRINSKSQLKEKDLLIVRSGAPGTSCVVTKDYEGCNAIDVIIARPNDKLVNPYYLCAFTNFPHGKIQIEDGTGGAAQQHFNVGKYKKLKVFLPPINMQNKFDNFIIQVNKSKFTNYKSLLLLIIKKIWYNNYM